jgi:hypothetical protein
VIEPVGRTDCFVGRSSIRNEPIVGAVVKEGRFQELETYDMRTVLKKVGIAAVVAVTMAGAAVSSADARSWGHRGGHWGGGGLALGAIAASSAYGYGYGYPAYAAYDDGYYGDCVIRKRVRYTPYGPVVRHVRVCY